VEFGFTERLVVVWRYLGLIECTRMSGRCDLPLMLALIVGGKAHWVFLCSLDGGSGYIVRLNLKRTSYGVSQ
jgi:hypothetical protein